MAVTEDAQRSARRLRILLNPLTTKELRATFRQPRFLAVYWISLALYSLVVLALAWGQVGREASAGEPVGQRLFNYCVAAQLALILFVLPGFAAATVTDERENQSFDLLVTTALTAFDIVWGKFLACLGYAFLFLSATFPLVCVSVLFSGVRPGEIVFAYGVMSMVAALVVSSGLATSAYGRSSRRSVAVTYAIALIGSAVCAGFGIWLRRAMPASYASLNLVGFCYDSVFHRGWASTVWAGVVPAVLWAIALSFWLVLSVNRLKPSSANKSTNLRVLGLVLMLAVLTATLARFVMAQGKLEAMVELGLAAAVLESVLLGVYLVGTACEEPRLSRRVQRQYQRASGFKWPLRLFLPGSASGLAYVLAASAGLLGVSTAVLAQLVLPPAVSATDPQSLGRLPSAQAALWWTAALLAAMIWFYAALGRWCSTAFAGAIYTRTVVIFAFVMSNLVPVCALALADQAAAESSVLASERPSTLWNMHYASAILSLRSVWDMTGFWPLTDRGLFHSKLMVHAAGIELPVGKLSVIFHVALATTLTLLGAWQQRRVIRPQLTLLYPTERYGTP